MPRQGTKVPLGEGNRATPTGKDLLDDGTENAKPTSFDILCVSKKGRGNEVKAEGGDFRQKILPDLDGVTRITLLSALNNPVVWACLHGEGEKSLGKPERLPFSKGIERKSSPLIDCLITYLIILLDYST